MALFVIIVHLRLVQQCQEDHATNIGNDSIDVHLKIILVFLFRHWDGAMDTNTKNQLHSVLPIT